MSVCVVSLSASVSSSSSSFSFSSSGYNTVVLWSLGLAVYPVLAVAYVDEQFPDTLSSGESYAIKASMVILAGTINAFGITLIGNSIIILSVLIVAPFAIGIGWNIHKIRPSQWIDGPPSGDYDFALFAATIIWLHTGFLHFQTKMKIPENSKILKLISGVHPFTYFAYVYEIFCFNLKSHSNYQLD